MAHRLGALVDLTEDQDSVHSTHMVSHNHLKLQFQGSDSSSDLHSTRHVHGAQTDIMHTPQNKNPLKKKKSIF